ncbi:hypothetical protein VTP01DRAFT_6780 [Rhizomucor pusillus]
MANSAVVPEAGRQCFTGLDDCPDGETCIPEGSNYGHCGVQPTTSEQ